MEIEADVASILKWGNKREQYSGHEGEHDDKLCPKRHPAADAGKFVCENRFIHCWSCSFLKQLPARSLRLSTM